MYSFRLTEEIARWAFEIICMENSDWYVAFTNPTAGPWKTIKCKNSSNLIGEVYRFDLEETRPDILLVNDRLELIIIFEAKDSLYKLISGNQAEKSIEVVSKLSDILINKNDNPFWGNRANYPIITGLLWGAETQYTDKERVAVFDEHYSAMTKYSNLDRRIIIGIETRRQADGLICYFCGKSYEKEGTNTIELAPIAKSFDLQMI